MNQPGPVTDLSQESDAEQRLEYETALFQLQRLASIGRLASGLGHEFNNTLQTIVASLELIRRLIETGRSADTPRFIQSAIASAQSAAKLNRQLRAFSTPGVPAPEVVDLNTSIEEMGEMLRRALPRTVVVEFSLASDLWGVFCDKGEAEHALLNLALNAWESLPEEGKISIQSDNATLDEAAAELMQLPPGDYVKVTIKDTGHGMSDDVLKRAFNAFFTTKQGAPIAGLGLSVVQHFARQSRGGVHIQSEAGDGTRALLFLARASTDAPSKTMPQA